MCLHQGLILTLTRFAACIPHAERLSRVCDDQNGEGASLGSGQSSGERNPTHVIGRNCDRVRGVLLGRKTMTYSAHPVQVRAETLEAGRGKRCGCPGVQRGCWRRARVAPLPRATPGTGATQVGARLHAGPASTRHPRILPFFLFFFFLSQLLNIYKRWGNTKMLI